MAPPLWPRGHPTTPGIGPPLHTLPLWEEALWGEHVTPRHSQAWSPLLLGARRLWVTEAACPPELLDWRPRGPHPLGSGAPANPTCPTRRLAALRTSAQGLARPFLPSGIPMAHTSHRSPHALPHLRDLPLGHGGPRRVPSTWSSPVCLGLSRFPGRGIWGAKIGGPQRLPKPLSCHKGTLLFYSQPSLGSLPPHPLGGRRGFSLPGPTPRPPASRTSTSNTPHGANP